MTLICIKNIILNKKILSDVYDLLSKHFVSWYWDKDLLTCENIEKEIVWGRWNGGCMLLFTLSLMCAQEKSQYQWTCASNLFEGNCKLELINCNQFFKFLKVCFKMYFLQAKNNKVVKL